MSSAAWTLAAIVGAATIIAVVKFMVHAIIEGLDQKLRPKWQEDIDTALDAALRPVLEELSFNGGTSVKDIVRRIDRAVEKLLAE